MTDERCKDCHTLLYPNRRGDLRHARVEGGKPVFFPSPPFDLMECLRRQLAARDKTIEDLREQYLDIERALWDGETERGSHEVNCAEIRKLIATAAGLINANRDLTRERDEARADAAAMWTAVNLECTCYEYMGGHQQGCPMYGMTQAQISKIHSDAFDCDNPGQPLLDELAALRRLREAVKDDELVATVFQGEEILMLDVDSYRAALLDAMKGKS